jgi:glycosyltransferase involved in cell wall biosynthesis
MHCAQNNMTSSMANTSTPLVSVGVPVRNGGKLLEEALATLTAQTYHNLEIIVSDNMSDDGSHAIAARFAANDSRVKVHRQPHPVTAVDNFKFVFDQSKGDYFMWAACDDRRSSRYVEKTLESLRARHDASIAFGDVAEFSDMDTWRDAPIFPYDFESDASTTLRQRIVKYSRLNCLHVYGLIRSSALRSYQWHDLDNGPDIPLLIHLSMAGNFVKSEDCAFYYFAPSTPKSLEERALANSLKKLKPVPEVRLAWACAVTIHHGGKMVNQWIPVIPAFFLVYANRHWRWIKPWLFEASPDFLVHFYRRFFTRRES